MYRGSSILLWKDYRIHRFAVREILRPTYDSLVGFRPTSEVQDTHAIAQILGLAYAIRDAYRDNLRMVNDHRHSGNITDTLVTKILFGTLACIPAYDANVIRGLREAHLPFSRLSGHHLEALFDWYHEHNRQFRRLQVRLRENGLRYPVMKLVDMYFWQKGQ